MPPQSSVRRDVPMTTPDTMASPFGCCNFFDRCAEDSIMSLHYAGGLPLLDWMGFNVSNECYRSVEFISFVRPDLVEGVCTDGHIGNPCDDPNGFEFGECHLTVEDFGRYGRHGPIRDFMKPKYYCRTDPRWRLDGVLVTDEDEWDQRFATDVIVQDISNDLIVGNATTAGQFDGLQRWVATGYDCEGLDSIVINWNGNPLTGGAGITWNGQPVAAAFTFYQVLQAAYRRIRTRIKWSPTLRAQKPTLGNFIMVMPEAMTNCLMDDYTCTAVCVANLFTNYESVTFRNSLVADVAENMFGNGFIRIDGTPIPLMAYDWSLINTDTDFDIYFLTGAVGSNRIWDGEHLSADAAAAKFGGMGYFSTDGGRMLGKWDVDNECSRVKMWMHPRLFCRAPWAQIRFQNVQCVTPGGPLNPDPCLYPDLYPAECP